MTRKRSFKRIILKSKSNHIRLYIKQKFPGRVRRKIIVSLHKKINLNTTDIKAQFQVELNLLKLRTLLRIQKKNNQTESIFSKQKKKSINKLLISMTGISVLFAKGRNKHPKEYLNIMIVSLSSVKVLFFFLIL